MTGTPGDSSVQLIQQREDSVDCLVISKAHQPSLARLIRPDNPPVVFFASQDQKSETCFGLDVLEEADSGMTRPQVAILFKFGLVLLSEFINTVTEHAPHMQHVLIFSKSPVEFEQSTESYGSPVGFDNRSVFPLT